MCYLALEVPRPPTLPNSQHLARGARVRVSSRGRTREQVDVGSQIAQLGFQPLQPGGVASGRAAFVAQLLHRLPE